MIAFFWLEIGAILRNMMKRGISFLSVLTMVAAMIFLSVESYGQSNVEVFGQNRIQRRKFDWKYFDTKHFRVYHYDRAGRQLGRYVAEEAENNIAVVEKKLGGQFPRLFNIILYNSYDEYRQSNVGLKDELQEIGNTRAGSLNLVGDKLVVYFTGEHADLKHQIRSGMSRVVMQRMIFGENFKKMVKNALLLNLPQWVTDGYIAYLVDGWDAKANSEWKGLLDARPDAGFYALSEQYPELAGKAFWKFISKQYGTGMVKNLLYSMQQKTNLNKAMKDSTNLRMKVTRAYDSCIHFYKDIYALDARHQEQPDTAHNLIGLKVPKDNTIIRNIRVSPNGNDVAYVAWREGRFTVYSQRTSGAQEVSTLLEGGMKDLTETIDPNYPMMAWSSTGQKLGILYKKGTKHYLKILNSVRGRIETIPIPDNRFDRVLGMTFMQDDDKLVFSAIRKSQSDLYIFTIKGSKLTNVTDDVWDDIAPEFISSGSRTGILFLSNRTKPNLNVDLAVNELPTGPMNVFFFNTRTMRPELLQCTHVTRGHITQPIQYGLDNFAYLYDSSGINNKFVILFGRDKHNADSAYSVPITNYNTSILYHQYNLASGDVADVIQVKDKYMVYFHGLQMPGVDAPVKTVYPATLSAEKPEPRVEPVQNMVVTPVHEEQNDEEPTQPSVKSGNAFQTEFSDSTGFKPRHKKRFRLGSGTADSSMLTEINDSAYLKMKPSKYRLSFKPDFFSIKLDNSVLFTQYQSIGANAGQFSNQMPGALTTLSLNELLENQRITAGFQLPFDGSSSTYFLQYQNFTRRNDWGVVFLRRQSTQFMDVLYVDTANNAFVRPQLFKSVSTLVQGDFSHPFDRVRSLRFHTGVRQDKLVEKVNDPYSLLVPIPDVTYYTSMSRLEYVFDNTITPVMNISNGIKFKLYADNFYNFSNSKEGYVVGMDVRNYKKLYKNFILANRFAYAHSGGNNSVQFLVGGVDNQLLPNANSSGNNPPSDPNYGFQALETSLRGYNREARAGNNFSVFTTELRLPVITTFFKRPIQSSILKNLQAVGFLDIGAAWKGFLPTTDNMTSVQSYPKLGLPSSGLNNVQLFLSIPNSAGVAVGYGAGLRSYLFGYFVRADCAWSIDSKKPIIYLGLGTDF